MKRNIAVVLMIASLAGAGAAQAADQWLRRPVDDRTFKSYLDFFEYDRQLPLATEQRKSEDQEGLRVEWLSFQSTRGVRVPAIVVEQGGGATGKKPAVILLHGGTARGKDGTLPFASLLARAGWTVLAIDLPHFGERASGLLTAFSEQEKHEKLYNEPATYLSWVIQLTKDVRRSYDFLIAERGVDPSRVALIGVSRGAIVGTIAGGVETRIAGVALYYGAHFDALETGHLPAACPANYIGRIAPRPLFMINGAQDSDMIRDRAVEPLYKLAKQPKQIVWTEGGHMFNTEEHRAALIQWLREKVRGR